METFRIILYSDTGDIYTASTIKFTDKIMKKCIEDKIIDHIGKMKNGNDLCKLIERLFSEGLIYEKAYAGSFLPPYNNLTEFCNDYSYINNFYIFNASSSPVSITMGTGAETIIERMKVFSHCFDNNNNIKKILSRQNVTKIFGRDIFSNNYFLEIF